MKGWVLTWFRGMVRETDTSKATSELVSCLEMTMERLRWLVLTMSIRRWSDSTSERGDDGKSGVKERVEENRGIKRSKIFMVC